MPAALTSTPFKLGAFTAVSSVFGAGLAAIALTYPVPEDPFGGAPVFEVELFQDAGMSAPASLKGSTTPFAPPAQKLSRDPARQNQSTAETAPTTEALNSEPAFLSRSTLSAAPPKTGTTNPASTTALQPPALHYMVGAQVTGDDRRGASTQGAQGGRHTDTYEAQVIRWLDAHKQHPGRLEGVVTLKFEVDRRGRVRDCVVTQTSGDERLDRIAQQQLRQAAPLPRPPHDVTWQTRQITVSLDYRRHA